jgi:hypothetical protein
MKQRAQFGTDYESSIFYSLRECFLLTKKNVIRLYTWTLHKVVVFAAEYTAHTHTKTYSLILNIAVFLYCAPRLMYDCCMEVNEESRFSTICLVYETSPM